LNYVLIEELNNAPTDAEWLSQLDPEIFYVKLSALNPVPNLPGYFRRASRADTERFAERVSVRGLTVTIFEGDGLDVQASCGQMAAVPRLVRTIASSGGQ
jgi:adenine C2-methylase RlmN of 23S rRNA A2503 and tRNA A37